MSGRGSASADPTAPGLEDLPRHLSTRVYGRAHEHHRRIGSTNDRAAAWARAGAPHGAVVTADAQTAGRGRPGRTWVSPPSGDVYASLVLRVIPRSVPLGALGLAVAVGLREALVPHGVDVALKWPNDLLCDGKKLAGILCESRWLGDRAEIVAGFGLNVGRREFPTELRGRATSLALALGPSRVPAPAPLLAEVLAHLEDVVERFVRRGFAAVRGRYEPHCVVLGREVELRGTDGRIARRVLADSLDEDGALRVRPLDGGPVERVESADVWLSPP